MLDDEPSGFLEIKNKHLLILGSCDQNALHGPYILGIYNRDLASDVFWGVKLQKLMLMTMMRTKVEAQVLIYLFRKSVEQCNVS